MKPESIGDGTLDTHPLKSAEEQVHPWDLPQEDFLTVLCKFTIIYRGDVSVTPLISTNASST